MEPKIDKCAGCGEEKEIIAKGLCRKCYDAQHKRKKPRRRKKTAKTAICIGCKEEKEILAKGKCCKCYWRAKSEERKRGKSTRRGRPQKYGIAEFGFSKELKRIADAVEAMIEKNKDLERLRIELLDSRVQIQRLSKLVGHGPMLADSPDESKKL